MSTIKRIHQSVNDYNAAINAHQGNFNEFMTDYEAIAGPIRQELVKQGQTLTGTQEIIKESGEFNYINAVAALTKRRTLAAMYASGRLAPLPEPTYTVWCTLQCGYVSSEFAPMAEFDFTPRYDRAAALSQPDAIATAIKIAEGRRENDKVYVLDTDENVMFSTWRPVSKPQGRKSIEYFEG